jgi:hypothetical protein
MPRQIVQLDRAVKKIELPDSQLTIKLHGTCVLLVKIPSGTDPLDTIKIDFSLNFQDAPLNIVKDDAIGYGICVKEDYSKIDFIMACIKKMDVDTVKFCLDGPQELFTAIESSSCESVLRPLINDSTHFLLLVEYAPISEVSTKESKNEWSAQVQRDQVLCCSQPTVQAGRLYAGPGVLLQTSGVGQDTSLSDLDKWGTLNVAQGVDLTAEPGKPYDRVSIYPYSDINASSTFLPENCSVLVFESNFVASQGLTYFYPVSFLQLHGATARPLDFNGKPIPGVSFKEKFEGIIINHISRQLNKIKNIVFDHQKIDEELERELKKLKQYFSNLSIASSYDQVEVFVKQRFGYYRQIITEKLPNSEIVTCCSPEIIRLLVSSFEKNIDTFMKPLLKTLDRQTKDKETAGLFRTVPQSLNPNSSAAQSVVGQGVILQGLTATQYNGVTGIVVKIMKDGRYRIQIDPACFKNLHQQNPKQNEFIGIKPENVRFKVISDEAKPSVSGCGGGAK